jgi:pimeloyl-ACP methyl ester carboxylesterase
MSALVLENGVAHYEYFGRGRPLVFIHGWLGSWRYWVPAMDALSEYYRVYAIDLWGFGDSAKPQNHYSVDSYVRLLTSFIRELGIMGPIPLVGHALGAAVAISFALEHPEETDRVMAVSLPSVDDSINQRFLSGGASILDRVLGRSPTAGYDDVEKEARRTAPEAIAQSIESVIHTNVQNRLSDLRIPLLIVHGDQDNVVAPLHEAYVSGLGKLARMMIIPGCRHFPMLDRSSQFNRLLLDFIESKDDLGSLELKDEWQRRIR